MGTSTVQSSAARVLPGSTAAPGGGGPAPLPSGAVLCSGSTGGSTGRHLQYQACMIAQQPGCRPDISNAIWSQLLLVPGWQAAGAQLAPQASTNRAAWPPRMLIQAHPTLKIEVHVLSLNNSKQYCTSDAVHLTFSSQCRRPTVQIY